MGQPRRKPGRAKWVGCVLSLLLIALWVSSHFWFLAYRRGQYGFYLAHDLIELESSAYLKRNRQGLRLRSTYPYEHWMAWTRPSYRRYSGGGWYCRVPLWLAAVIACTATMLLFQRERRRSPEGLCKTCGGSLVNDHPKHCDSCLQWIRSFRLLLVSCGAAGFYAKSPAMNIPLTTFYAWVTIMLGWPLFPIILRRVRGYNGVPEGYCQDCGYNLTGNVSGRCPECGLGVPPAAAQESPA